MRAGFPRLIGDIGATNARWAWQVDAESGLSRVVVSPCADSPSLQASALAYLAAGGLGRPAAVAIGIATTITGDWIQMTNHPWCFSIDDLKRTLTVEHCVVINDFMALAFALPLLRAQDLRQVGGGQAVPGGPIALLGPGTGLGVSGLMPPLGSLGSADAASLATPISGEGGHVTLAATNEREAAILARLRLRFGHASAERVLSGQGLLNLYEAQCSLAGQVPRQLTPAELSRSAIERSDAQCVETLRLFARFLGNVAGNLALTLGARGGVYIGGGIVPGLGSAFDDAGFRRAFEDKGRFADYLAAMPTWVITAATPGLTGAARAIDLLPR